MGVRTHSLLPAAQNCSLELQTRQLHSNRVITDYFTNEVSCVRGQLHGTSVEAGSGETLDFISETEFHLGQYKTFWRECQGGYPHLWRQKYRELSTFFPLEFFTTAGAKSRNLQEKAFNLATWAVPPPCTVAFCQQCGEIRDVCPSPVTNPTSPNACVSVFTDIAAHILP